MEHIDYQSSVRATLSEIAQKCSKGNTLEGFRVLDILACLEFLTSIRDLRKEDYEYLYKLLRRC